MIELFSSDVTVPLASLNFVVPGEDVLATVDHRIPSLYKEGSNPSSKRFERDWLAPSALDGCSTAQFRYDPCGYIK
jgi:hypothetical protein